MCGLFCGVLRPKNGRSFTLAVYFSLNTVTGTTKVCQVCRSILETKHDLVVLGLSSPGYAYSKM